MDDFLAWFPNIIAVREKYGFKVLFAYAARERNEFVWAVGHDGDFDASCEIYNVSPERAEAFKDQPTRVAKMHLAMVEPVVPGAVRAAGAAEAAR
jgi:hypothetical protein